MKKIKTPILSEDIEKLKAGDVVSITGPIYAARDTAHQRLVELLNRGEKLPMDIKGQAVYYVGPSPAKPGQAIGSAGPTTSGRMDPYSPALLERGLKIMIGKGSRSPAVKEAIIKHRAVYLAAVGGAAALISQSIKKCELVAYEDLGPEAIYRLQVEDFPAVVVNDCRGRDLYEEGAAGYRLA